MNEEQLTGFEGDVPAEWNAITHRIIGAAIEVHRGLEPGLPEAVYERALLSEFRRCGLRASEQVRFEVKYKGEGVGALTIDLLVEDLVVVELKSVETVNEVHLAQLMGYLHISHKPLGLLINFHVVRLREGVFRRINARALRPQSPAALSHPTPSLSL